MSTGSAELHPVEDLPAFMTGELAPEDARRTLEHLDGCVACLRELAHLTATTATLTDTARVGLAGMPGLPTLGFDPESVTQEHPPVLGLPPRRRPRLAAVLVSAAAVLLLVAGGVTVAVVARSRPSAQAATTVALRPLVAGSTAHGTAAMQGHGEDQRMRVTVTGLASAPPGHYYELWLLRSDGSAVQPVGVLPPGGGVYPLPTSVTTGYDRLDVSIEAEDGNAAHSGVSVLRGNLA